MSEQPNITTQAGVNDNATQRVPQSERKGMLNVALVTAGFCICMSGLFTGASMAAGLDLKTAIIATLIGNLILAGYGGLVGMAGAREGVASSLLARHSFGFVGSKVVSLVLALSMAGWYAYQVGFFGETIAAMFPQSGFLLSAPAAAVWGGVLMLLSAYFGYKGLAVLSYIVVPLITLVALWGMILAVGNAGGWSALASMAPKTPISLGAGVVLAVGSFAGGASAQADINRYAKDSKSAWVGTIFGYVIANSFVILAGFVTSMATGEGNLPAAMLALGMGFPAMLVLIGAQWTTNDNNLYTSSLGIINIFPKLNKKHVTLAVGLIATAFGALGVANYFTTWLNILGLFVPPMAGILLSDYFFVKGMHYDFGPGTKYIKWNIIAFVSWSVGALIGKFLTWGIGSLNALVVTAVVYVVLMRTIGKNKFGQIGEVIEK